MRHHATALVVAGAVLPLFGGSATGQDLVCYDYDSYGRIERATYSDGSQLVYAIDHGDSRESLTQATGQTPECATPDGAGTGGGQGQEPPSGNSAPTANPNLGFVQINQTVSVQVVANDTDPDGDPLTVISLVQPSAGSASITPDGKSIVFTAPSVSGTHVITHTISDGNGGTATTGLSINVTSQGELEQ